MKKLVATLGIVMLVAVPLTAFAGNGIGQQVSQCVHDLGGQAARLCVTAAQNDWLEGDCMYNIDGCCNPYFEAIDPDCVGGDVPNGGECYFNSQCVSGLCDFPAGGNVGTCLGLPEGALCADTSQCSSGLICIDGSCVDPMSDCAGEWGGTATLDECGTCDTDSTNDCEQDCAGEWGGNAALDPCNICAGGGTGFAPCTTSPVFFAASALDSSELDPTTTTVYNEYGSAITKWSNPTTYSSDISLSWQADAGMPVVVRRSLFDTPAAPTEGDEVVAGAGQGAMDDVSATVGVTNYYTAFFLDPVGDVAMSISYDVIPEEIPPEAVLSLGPDEANEYALDTYTDPYLHKKVLAPNDDEILNVTKSAEMIATGLEFEYAIRDTDIVTLNVQPIDGESDALTFSALQEGYTHLEISVLGIQIQVIELHVFGLQTIAISYQYISYPGEDLTLKQQTVYGCGPEPSPCDVGTVPLIDAIAVDMSSTINSIYNPCGVLVEVTLNGVSELDIDIDNNQALSYGDQGREIELPLAVTPEETARNAYFSNLYATRYIYDDSYYGGSNGNGTSLGFGRLSLDDDIGLEPDLDYAGLLDESLIYVDTWDRWRYPNEARGAFVGVHLYRTPFSVADTLAHELGHNLGLIHYSQYDFEMTEYQASQERMNLMKVGRQEPRIFPFQCSEIHKTIDWWNAL